MCSEPAIDYNFDPPHLHSAVISGLVRGCFLPLRLPFFV